MSVFSFTSVSLMLSDLDNAEAPWDSGDGGRFVRLLYRVEPDAVDSTIGAVCVFGFGGVASTLTTSSLAGALPARVGTAARELSAM